MAQFDDVDMELSDCEDWYDFALEDEACPSKTSLGEIECPSKTSLGEIECPSKTSPNEIGSWIIDNYHAFGKNVEKNNSHLTIENMVKESVLPFLPAKVLTRFRSVSKQWDSWIQGHILAHRQSYSFMCTSGFFCQHNGASPTFLSLNPSVYDVPEPSLKFLPGQVDIVASSHGLIICRAQDGNNTYYVCNPAEQTWRQLPKPEYYHGPNSAHVLMFEPHMRNIEGHYELVCAFSLVGQAVVFFEIYSSETDLWRCSPAMYVDIRYLRFVGPGFHMKGMAYWVTSGMQVLAFDPKNDVYGVMQLPTEYSPYGALAGVHNELCYANISKASSNKYVMQLYYGMDLKLKQDMELELELEPVLAGEQGLCRVLPCFEEDRLMILFGDVLYSYGVVGGRIEVVRRGVGSMASDAVNAKFVPYVNSLVRVV